MSLHPLNDTIFGRIIEYEGNPGLMEEIDRLSVDLGGEFDSARRQLSAQLAPQKQPFQVEVVAIGPDVRDVHVGDVVILPQGGGSLVTITDDETGTFSRVFLISERAVLATFRVD